MAGKKEKRENKHNCSRYCKGYYLLPYQSLSGEDLQELEEKLSIAEIGVQIEHLAVDATQMGVDPLGERLLLNMLTLDWKKTNKYK